MEEIRINEKIGGWTAVAGAITNLTLFPLFFLLLYKVLYNAELQKQDISAFGCAMVVKWYYPAFTDFGILSGVLYVIAAYFFFEGKKQWGYTISVIAVVNGLMWSFWPMVPALDTGNPGYHAIIFVLNFIYYLLLTRLVQKKPWPRVILGMIVGMAMITSFMNGIANTNRAIIYHAEPIFVLGQRLNFVAGLAWMVIVITFLLWPKQPWLKAVVLATGILELIVGLPIGIDMSITKHTFSMFLLGPIFSTITLVILLVPGLWEKMVAPEK